MSPEKASQRWSISLPDQVLSGEQVDVKIYNTNRDKLLKASSKCLAHGGGDAVNAIAGV